MRTDLSDSDRVALNDRQAYAYQLLQAAQIRKKDFKSALITAERGRARAFVENLARRFSTSPVPSVEPPDLADIQNTARREKATLVSL
jgi:hypothetical protein